MQIRPALLWLHRYLGLLATIPLILLSLSGAVLTFESEIDRAINPGLWRVTPQGQPRGWDELTAAVHAAYPTEAVQNLLLPAKADIAAQFALKGGRMVTVDPYSGRVLGSRRREDVLTSQIHQFHTHLLSNTWGEKVVGASTIVMLILGPTGIVLWWRRKGFAIKWSAPWRRVNYDAHHAMGIYSLLFWMILSGTGAVMVFESVLRPDAPKHEAHAAGSPATQKINGVAPRPVPVQVAMDAAMAALPDAKVAVISIPQTMAGTFTAFMKFPEDRTPAGRSRVSLDASGRMLWMESSRTAPTAMKLWNLNRPIHTGDIFGWPTRLLACVASIALAVQCISGVWMWWPRRKAKNGLNDENGPQPSA